MTEQKGMTDEQIVTGIRTNDPVALRTLYRQHYKMIVHFIRQNNGSEADAKDIYQEAMIVLVEKIRKEEFELLSKLKTFIYAVSRRLWLKQLKKNERYSGEVKDHEYYEDWTADTDDIESLREQHAVIEKSMAELGEPCKTVLVDFYFRGYTMEEIATKMGYTNPANAKNQKYKCFQRLKKLVLMHKTHTCV